MEEEEKVTTDDERKEPGLTDVLFNQLQIGPILISQMVNGDIRDEILRSLIRAGLLTTDQLLATLDKAEGDAQEFCDRIESRSTLDYSREVLQSMRETAEKIVATTRRHVIEQPSSSPQQETSGEG